MGLTCCHSVRVVLSSARATSLRSESELAVQNPEVFNVRANPGPAADAEGVFAQLFDLSPFPAVVSRLHDHTVLAVNARTSELFGVPQREAVGLSVTDYYVDPSERLRLADQIRGATAGRTVFGCRSSGRNGDRSGSSRRSASSPGAASPPFSPSSTTSASSSPPKRRSRPASAGWSRRATP